MKVQGVHGDGQLLTKPPSNRSEHRVVRRGVEDMAEDKEWLVQGPSATVLQ